MMREGGFRPNPLDAPGNFVQPRLVGGEMHLFLPPFQSGTGFLYYSLVFSKPLEEPTIGYPSRKMAEEIGFEPMVVLPTLVFKTSALNRSATLP